MKSFGHQIFMITDEIYIPAYKLLFTALSVQLRSVN